MRFMTVAGFYWRLPQQIKMTYMPETKGGLKLTARHRGLARWWLVAKRLGHRWEFTAAGFFQVLGDYPCMFLDSSLHHTDTPWLRDCDTLKRRQLDKATMEVKYHGTT